MKKLNRKKRKLRFIRWKNNLRLGRTRFYCTEKVSLQLLEEGRYDFRKLIDTAKASVLKEYKLKLNNAMIDSGLMDDDYIKDLVTFRVTLFI